MDHGSDTARKANEKEMKNERGVNAGATRGEWPRNKRNEHGRAVDPQGVADPQLSDEKQRNATPTGRDAPQPGGGAVDPSEGGRGPPTIRKGSRKGGAKEARRTRARGAADPQKGGRGPPKIRKGTKERNANQARRTRARERGVVDPKRGVVDPQKES